MKRNSCRDCKKETTNGVYILTGKGWIYEFYCINCTRAYLGRMSTKSLLKLNRTQLTHASEQYDMMLQNSIPKMKAGGIERDEMPVEYKKFIIKKSDGFV